jgi:hypothetical protein
MTPDNIRYVHVDPVTGEERPPRGRELFLTVETDGNFEFVEIQNIELHDRLETTIEVKPRGKGWERYDTRSDKRTVWRRKVVRHA